jgi:hypothetical protein
MDANGVAGLALSGTSGLDPKQGQQALHLVKGQGQSFPKLKGFQQMKHDYCLLSDIHVTFGQKSRMYTLVSGGLNSRALPAYGPA